MNGWISIVIIFAAALFPMSAGTGSNIGAAGLCSDSWYRFIEAKVQTGDGQGHGPDAGSDEWKSVVEFKLGIRGDPKVPERDSEAWCRYIDMIVRQKAAPS